jgi:predicted membrane protein
MKKSPFKILLLIINTLSLLLLIVLCWYSGVFECIQSKLLSVSFFQALIAFFSGVFSNPYFINIICTVITALFLYYFQVSYSKRHLKKDFRCNEILNGLAYGIEEAKELSRKIKSIDGLNTKEKEPDYLKREADNGK